MFSLLSLKSKAFKQLKNSTVSQIALLSCLTLPFTVNAQDGNNEKLQLHGFIAQGLVNVNGSDFVNDSGDITTELTEIGINASYQFTPTLRFAGQAVYLDGGNRFSKGARIDYALLDWMFYNDSNWLANLYLGRYKNTHWLYSGTRDVPHTRPSIILPQSIYFDGFRDIAMGSDGASTKLSYSGENIGELDFTFSYGSSELDKDDIQLLLGDMAQGTGDQKYVGQASIYWTPEFSSWRFGLSMVDSVFTYEATPSDMFADAEFAFKQYTFAAMYEGEFWEFSSETTISDFGIEGFYVDGFEQTKVGQGIYLQTRYRLTDKVRLLARVEKFYADRDDKDGKKLEAETGGLVPAYFGYQNSAVVGASVDFSDNLRVQMEYHRVQGTARLTPVVFPNVLLNDSEDWDMWALQLMYWF